MPDSEERFRTLIENVSEIVAVFDVEGGLQYVSPSVQRVLGYSPDEVRQAAILNLIHPDDRATVAGYFAEAHTPTGRQTLGRFRICHADRSWRTLEATLGLPFGISQGFGAVVTFRDVTEHVQVEDALRASEERYRDLFENANDIIYTHDLAGNFTGLSRAAEQILGYTPDEALKLNITQIITPEFLPQALEMMERKLAGSGATTYSLEVLAKDGHRVALEVGTRLVYENGQPVAVQGIARDVTERTRLQAQLVHQAFHDPLTGMPNRQLFLDRLRHALGGRHRQRELVGVIFLDLDGFKIINDSLGHPAGDALLVELCARLTSVVAATDTVARFGGDEFAVLLEGLTDPADAVRIVERLLAAIRAPLSIEGRVVYIAASAGVALAPRGRPGVDAEGLLRQVDTALYQAKGAGKDRFAVFDPVMQAAAIDRLELETDLRRAIEREEFVLYYQPEVDLERGVISGVEALLRWQHPTRGLLAPAKFITVAEEAGLILEIDRWVLRAACRQLRAWQRRPGGDPTLLVSVNISSRLFAQANLAAQVAAILRETELAPATLRLEISETSAVQDWEAAVARMRELSQLGVQLAIDDFGAGYSSLSYLRRFPVDVLKIDRSFVREVTRDAATETIVRAVVQLALLLDIEVIAEGVESAEQLILMREFGCRRSQGHLFSPAAPASATSALLTCGLSRELRRVIVANLRAVS